MTRINPDAIRSDVIVSARTSEKNHLIQLSCEDFRFICDVAAPALDVSPTDFLLSVHGLRPSLNGQGDLLMEEPPVENDDMSRLDTIANDKVKKALERQAVYFDLPTDEYLARLIFRGLIEDEKESIVEPSTGIVLTHRERCGSLLKSMRLPQPRGVANATR
jgi:hypothetical protein